MSTMILNNQVRDKVVKDTYSYNLMLRANIAHALLSYLWVYKLVNTSNCYMLLNI